MLALAQAVPPSLGTAVLASVLSLLIGAAIGWILKRERADGGMSEAIATLKAEVVEWRKSSTAVVELHANLSALKEDVGQLAYEIDRLRGLTHTLGDRLAAIEGGRDKPRRKPPEGT